jgi:hypothetical protein
MASFLEEAGYAELHDPAFPRLALAWSLLHQGVGQQPIDLPVMHDVATLDEVAERTFAVRSEAHSPRDMVRA